MVIVPRSLLPEHYRPLADETVSLFLLFFFQVAEHKLIRVLELAHSRRAGIAAAA
ncbi:hypothetical protein [Jiella pelagia]|uniref:Uncharacterized protein n=1 Tax=Jiella pelagia TaxID=2986949 RepID=A0ABY7C1V5_9HYPH|nr:hypothetical protein [Jiella pelagia]WAP68845.1 hypothetical protein OH818_27080 [Jiella pelagia]